MRRKRVRSDEAATPFLSILLAALAVSATWYSVEVNREPSPFTHEGSVAGLRVSMYLAILGIEQFRHAYGRTPPYLEGVGVDDARLSYVVRPQGYELVGTLPHEGVRLVYQRGDDLGPYLQALDLVGSAPTPAADRSGERGLASLFRD